MAVDVKQAIAAAKAYAAELLGVTDLLLEEVRSDDATFTVTLSLPDRRQSPLVSPFSKGQLREYKQFQVSKDTGVVEAMSIRQIA